MLHRNQSNANSDTHRGFTHDENTYNDPTAFRPERFLGSDSELDPHTLSFGFGRRICPGRFLADSTIFGTIAQSLAVFNFSKGDTHETKAEFLPGVVSHPVPYRLQVEARSEAHDELIRQVEVECPWEKSDAWEIEQIEC